MTCRSMIKKTNNIQKLLYHMHKNICLYLEHIKRNNTKPFVNFLLFLCIFIENFTLGLGKVSTWPIQQRYFILQTKEASSGRNTHKRSNLRYSCFPCHKLSYLFQKNVFSFSSRINQQTNEQHTSPKRLYPLQNHQSRLKQPILVAWNIGLHRLDQIILD